MKSNYTVNNNLNPIPQKHYNIKISVAAEKETSIEDQIKKLFKGRINCLRKNLSNLFERINGNIPQHRKTKKKYCREADL